MNKLLIIEYRNSYGYKSLCDNGARQWRSQNFQKGAILSNFEKYWQEKNVIIIFVALLSFAPVPVLRGQKRLSSSLSAWLAQKFLAGQPRGFNPQNHVWK